MDFFLNKSDEVRDPPTNLDEKINDLKRKMEELNALKEDRESGMSTELHPRKKLKKEVELWFRNVERINSEIQDLEVKFGKSTVDSRGLLKGNVFKRIQEVEELLQQGKGHVSLVVDNPAKNCMEKIWTYLMSADVKKIGVWGIGGIGKTTIMKLVHNQLLKETEKFDIVIWVTVSKEMNIIKLQNRIAREMKVTLDEDEDVTIRAGVIRKMLAHKGKYVLILDDLWDRLSLEEVGIPEPSNGSKLLVTTRLLDVCHYLGCREVRVSTLSKPDAWGLFLEKVGQDVLNHPDLLPIVESVAEECDGLPLAIVTIASSMKGVRDIHEWRNAVRELNRNIKSVNGMEEKVFKQLQFSYDRLRDEKVKNCFLCCALYPKDFEIDTDELIKLWIAEGLVEEMDSMQIEIDKGHNILNKLKNSCLIEDGNSGGVKLHGVVRGMALRITSVRPRFLVRAGMQLKEILDVKDWNEDLEKASLMENWELQIPSQMPTPNCPKLTTLLLSNSNIQSIPECFFEQMHGLKILDLSYNGIKSLPNSISILKTLTTLLLGCCEDLENVPSFSNFEALKMLNLEKTSIKNIPHGMERLINLRYLDLSGAKITEIGDGILAKFTSLQHLNFEDSLVRGEEIGGLRKLEFFKGGFYDFNEWKSFVQALHASKRGLRQFNIFVGPKSDHSFYGQDKMIELNGCNIGTDDFKILSNVEVLSFEECIVDLCEGAFLSRCIPVPLNIFSSLSKIEIYNCKNIKKLLSSNWVLHNLQNLSYLRVEGCEEMEEIIAAEPELEEEGISSPSFNFTLPNLRQLELWGLPELKSICGANGVMVCDSIEVIEIVDCPKLKRIHLNLTLQDDGQPSSPPLISMHNLQNLETLFVEGCDEMEEIIASESELEEEEISSASFKFTFPKLRQLELRNLPELKSICGANGVMVCNSIEEISLINCPKLKRIPLNLLSQDDGQPSPPSLISMHNLQNLVSLSVEGCEEMEEIIASELEEEGISSASFKFTLPKLSRLGLWNLPELKSICGANGVMVCDSIQQIFLINCPKLKRIPLNLPLQDDGQPSPPPSLREINAYPKEWWELVEWDHPNAKSLLEPYKFTSSKKLVRGEEKGGLRKLGIFKGSFYDLNELNSYVQALHEPRQYRIYVGHQPAAENESYAESEKFIELNGCNICKDGSKILSDVEELRIESCIVDSCEEAFLSRFIPVPKDIFSSLSRIEIIYCQKIKKLFPSNWVLHNLQNLDILCVRGCKEIEEIIASESELEEEVKFTLPKLCWLELYDLPELKSICSPSGIMVCDSIEKIYIGNCPNLKRIPLNLPLRDDGQPYPPPFLRTITAYPEEWWELVEWDHPNAKSLLEPYVENWPVL